MVSIVIPPVSDCFMPTLGAAQIVSFLRSNKVSSKLFDLSAELQRFILDRYSVDDSSSAVRRYTNAIKDCFGVNREYVLKYDNFSSIWDWRKPDSDLKLLSVHRDLCEILCHLPSFSKLVNSKYVGFSISYESQLIPALLLACLIKQRNSVVTVIFGGSFFYNYSKDFTGVLDAFSFVDALIIGQGEAVLLDIIQSGLAISSKYDKNRFYKIGDHYIFDSRVKEKNIVVYEPDFSDLNFDNYLSLSKAFPYMIRNRCYYGGCKFCNGDRDCGALQIKNINLAFQSMRNISRRIGVKNVYITDAALSPKDFQAISKMAEPTEISWIANARFEPCLNDCRLLKNLKHKGCKMLRFGLESGSQKVLDLMNKGIDLKIAAQIMRQMFDAGIMTHVYIMFGYWGETPLDRKKTIQFLNENKSFIASYSISIFQPIAETKIYKELLDVAKNLGFSTKDEYGAIISALYPDEKEYSSLLNDVEKIKSILHSHAHTNAEFYSANIFSDEKLGDSVQDISIQFLPKVSEATRYER